MTLTPRSIRLDLKCGRGAISQGEKCRKGPATRKKDKPLLTAGNIAKVAAVVATPFAIKAGLKTKQGKYLTSIVRTVGASIGKKPFPKGKTKADWFELQNGPAIREGNRMRRYETNIRMRSIQHEEFAEQLRNVAGGSRESQLVADLIRKNKISIDSKMLDDIIDSPSLKSPQNLTMRNLYMDFREQLKTNPQAEGFFMDSGVAPGAPDNKVYINFRRNSTSEWSPTRQGVKKAMSDFKTARINSIKNKYELVRDPSPETISTYTKSFATYQNADADDRDLLVGLHEIGHSLDIGIGKRARPMVVKDLDTGLATSVLSKDFSQQARKVTSHYGLSDLAGTRDEFFSETFVLYTLEPDHLKKEAPLVYTWMDTYISKLRQA